MSKFFPSETIKRMRKLFEEKKPSHFVKAEKTLKGSLDLIPLPSPTVKIQIMGGKVCLRCKGKTLHRGWKVIFNSFSKYYNGQNGPMSVKKLTHF